jgi:hypothetical protein
MEASPPGRRSWSTESPQQKGYKSISFRQTETARVQEEVYTLNNLPESVLR